MDEKTKQYQLFLQKYQKEPFLFFEEVLGLKPCKGIEEIRDVEFRLANNKLIKLFDKDGNICYFDDYSVYKKKYFEEWKEGMLTWQQMMALSAYRDALNTFDTDFTETFKKRWITIKSGRGSGKSAVVSLVALHFLYCFPGSQTLFITTELNQIKTVFIKELSIWFKKLPQEFQDNTIFLEEEIRINGEKDWFIRTRVSNPRNEVSLSGFHAKYALVLLDEASGIGNTTFNTMRGTLTGNNFVSFMTGNPNFADGEFYESHKKKFANIYTQITFNCEESPIVTEASRKFVAEKFGLGSDEYRITVLGNFPGEGENDDKGWIPLYSGININYEPLTNQSIIKPLLGLDPAGSGKNKSVLVARDNVYLMSEFAEETSSPRSLARRCENIINRYGIPYSNLEIDVFGVGASVINEFTSQNGRPRAFLGTEKMSDPDKELYATNKMKRAWLLREWLNSGGVILTNNREEWERELSKIKYRRTSKGKMELMDKIEFKKTYGFSPDFFDATLYTFGSQEYAQSVFNEDEYATTEDEWMRRNKFTNIDETKNVNKKFDFGLKV